MHTALRKSWWALEGNSHTRSRVDSCKDPPGRRAGPADLHTSAGSSVWADSKPPPCTHSYVHHVSCQKTVCLGTQVTGATPAVTEPVYHLGLSGAILKSGPGTGRNLQRWCAPCSVLWDSPDLLSDLESQRQVSGQPAEVLLHAGSQDFSYSTAAASAKTTPRMDLGPNRKGLFSSPDLKGVRGLGQGGRNRGEHELEWHSSPRGQPQTEGRVTSRTPRGWGRGEPIWPPRIESGGSGRTAGSCTSSCLCSVLAAIPHLVPSSCCPGLFAS